MASSERKTEASKFCFTPCVKNETGDYIIPAGKRGIINSYTSISVVESPSGLVLKSYQLLSQIEKASHEHGLQLQLGQLEETGVDVLCCYLKNIKNKSLIDDMTALTKKYKETHSLSLDINVANFLEGKILYTVLMVDSRNIDPLMDFMIWLKKNYIFSFSLEAFKNILKKREEYIDIMLKEFIATPPKHSFSFLTEHKGQKEVKKSEASHRSETDGESAAKKQKIF